MCAHCQAVLCPRSQGAQSQLTQEPLWPNPAPRVPLTEHFIVPNTGDSHYLALPVQLSLWEGPVIFLAIQISSS